MSNLAEERSKHQLLRDHVAQLPNGGLILELEQAHVKYADLTHYGPLLQTYIAALKASQKPDKVETRDLVMLILTCCDKGKLDFTSFYYNYACTTIHAR